MIAAQCRRIGTDPGGSIWALDEGTLGPSCGSVSGVVTSDTQAAGLGLQDPTSSTVHILELVLGGHKPPIQTPERVRTEQISQAPPLCAALA